jgi:hypothetical protein
MRIKPLVLVVLFAAAVLLYFPAKFALTFEMFGNAVNSPSAGWLGPMPRNAGSCALDAGKVSSWQCADISVFTEHRYGCQLWLRVFGYIGA